MLKGLLHQTIVEGNNWSREWYTVYTVTEDEEEEVLDESSDRITRLDI